MSHEGHEIEGAYAGLLWVRATNEDGYWREADDAPRGKFAAHDINEGIVALRCVTCGQYLGMEEE